MKRECRIKFFGQKFTVVRKKMTGENADLGGYFDPINNIIGIDYKYDEDRFRDYLLHELTEYGINNLGCNYSRTYPDKEDLFIMNHRDFTTLMSEARGAYDEVVEALK